MVEFSQTERDAAITRRRKRSAVEEEEEPLLTFRGRHQPEPKSHQAARKKTPRRAQTSRLQYAANFAVPVREASRPVSASGAVSFHFSFETLTKQGASGHQPSIGARHARYLERANAAELRGAAHSKYLERASAVERAGASGWLDAVSGDAVCGFAEGRDLECGTSLIFTNIHTDIDVRCDYWDAVERSERVAAGDTLKFDSTKLQTWYLPLIATDDIPVLLRAHLAEHVVKLAMSRSPVVPPLPVTAEQAGTMLSWARATPGWTDAASPLRFAPGRGGRTQYRLIAELPHELDSAGRAEIVRRFVAGLGARGLMYNAVVHLPDAHGDAKNYHVHVDYYDRPARYLAEHGCWDFEYHETRTDGHRNTRDHYPHRQAKVKAVAQTYLSDGGFVGVLRNEFAGISNQVLAARGVPTRYDPRTYVKMGIEQTPSAHLGPKASALERMGVPTPVGTRNAKHYWDDREQAILDRPRQVLEKVVHSLASELRKTIDVTSRISGLMGANALAVLAEADLQSEIDHLALLERKARSRAVATVGNCDKIIANIDAGQANSSTAATRPALVGRRREALAHLATLDLEFALDAPLIANMLRKASRLGAEVVQTKAVLDSATALAAQPEMSGLIDSGGEPAAEAEAKDHPSPVSGETQVAVAVPGEGIDELHRSNVDVVKPARPVPPEFGSKPHETTPVHPAPVQPGLNEGPDDDRDRAPYGSTAYGLEATPAARARLAAAAAVQIEASGRNGLRDVSAVDVVSVVQRLGGGSAGDRLERSRAAVFLQPPAQLQLPSEQVSSPVLLDARDGAGPTGSRASLASRVLAAPVADAVAPQTAAPAAVSPVGVTAPAVMKGAAGVTSPQLAAAPGRTASVAPPPVATPKPTLLEQLDRVIDLVIAQNIVLVESDIDVDFVIDAPTLPDADRRLLRSSALVAHTEMRLADLLEAQTAEINQVIRWFRTVVDQPSKYSVTDSKVQFHPPAPKPIGDLIQRFEHHPALDVSNGILVAKARQHATDLAERDAAAARNNMTGLDRLKANLPQRHSRQAFDQSHRPRAVTFGPRSSTKQPDTGRER